MTRVVVSDVEVLTAGTRYDQGQGARRPADPDDRGDAAGHAGRRRANGAGGQRRLDHADAAQSAWTASRPKRRQSAPPRCSGSPRAGARRKGVADRTSHCRSGAARAGSRRAASRRSTVETIGPPSVQKRSFVNESIAAFARVAGTAAAPGPARRSLVAAQAPVAAAAVGTGVAVRSLRRCSSRPAGRPSSRPSSTSRASPSRTRSRRCGRRAAARDSDRRQEAPGTVSLIVWGTRLAHAVRRGRRTAGDDARAAAAHRCFRART